MEPEFWYRRWEAKEIGFHEPEGNRLLRKSFHQLALKPSQRIFVPLCGKTRDIAWLLSQGVRVVGAELSEIAILELFDELQMVPKVSKLAKLKLYSALNLEVFIGNFFDLDAAVLGKIDAIYDRAALIALPPELRQSYAAKLVQMTNHSTQLVICLVYDQSLMKGPPFSVDAAELAAHYACSYKLRPLEKVEVKGGLKGVFPAHEEVWLLG